MQKPQKKEIGSAAQKKHRLSNEIVQMAKTLGLNPKQFSQISLRIKIFMSKFFKIIIIMLLLSSPASAKLGEGRFPPSFNCTKAYTPEEKLICFSNEEWRLGILDFLVHEKYTFLMKRLDKDKIQDLQMEQRDWLKKRDISLIKLDDQYRKKWSSDDEAYLQAYLEKRHQELTDKVIELTKNDLELGNNKTEIFDKNAAKKILGKKKLSLQLDENFGSVTIAIKDDIYTIRGEQTTKDTYLFIKGWISCIKTRYFIFIGEITSKGSYLDKPCVRKGRFTFAITKNRSFWRLQEMSNPRNQYIDYVDIYFDNF